MKRSRLSRKRSKVKTSRLSSALEKDIAATKQAYADNWIAPPANESMGSPEWNAWEKKVYNERNLAWKGTKFYSPKQWMELAKVVGGYNKFTPDLVFQRVRDLPVELKLAREGSVAVYVKGSDSALKEVAKRFRGYADEIDRVMTSQANENLTINVPEKNEKSKYLRLWWD